MTISGRPGIGNISADLPGRRAGQILSSSFPSSQPTNQPIRLRCHRLPVKPSLIAAVLLRCYLLGATMSDATARHISTQACTSRHRLHKFSARAARKCHGFVFALLKQSTFWGEGISLWAPGVFLLFMWS